MSNDPMQMGHPPRRNNPFRASWKMLVPVLGFLVLTSLCMVWWCYSLFVIEVPAYHFAILVRKTGADIQNADELAPTENHKGLQSQILTEGRYYKNPYVWGWKIYPMVQIPTDKMGVRTRLYGQDLGYGEFVARDESTKGFVQQVLRPGRYAINAAIIGQEYSRPTSDYLELVELHDPVQVPAGFKGVVTNLSGPIPEESNTLLVEEGFRGVQKDTLDEGTYYLNPYEFRVNQIDTRSQRFDISKNRDFYFPSKDGFPIRLDGVIEFRVTPEKAAEVYVTYNDESNGDAIDEEIIKKIILPNARSICRINGADNPGRDFIGGDTRRLFQEAFAKEMTEKCLPLGIEIVQAVITEIDPPNQIAEPVRAREIAHQQEVRYKQETLQAEQEQVLEKEKATVEQRTALVAANQEVVKKVKQAEEAQEVELTKASEELAVAKLVQKQKLTEAEKRKAVAELQLQAAKDKASAIVARGKAEAEVVTANHSATAAGWKKNVDAYEGNGLSYARKVLLEKIAPGYRRMMTNTATDNPLMDVLKSFGDEAPGIEVKAAKPE